MWVVTWLPERLFIFCTAATSHYCTIFPFSLCILAVHWTEKGSLFIPLCENWWSILAKCFWLPWWRTFFIRLFSAFLVQIGSVLGSMISQWQQPNLLSLQRPRSFHSQRLERPAFSLEKWKGWWIKGWSRTRFSGQQNLRFFQMHLRLLECIFDQRKTLRDFDVRKPQM